MRFHRGGQPDAGRSLVCRETLGSRDAETHLAMLKVKSAAVRAGESSGLPSVRRMRICGSASQTALLNWGSVEDVTRTERASTWPVVSTRNDATTVPSMPALRSLSG